MKSYGYWCIISVSIYYVEYFHDKAIHVNGTKK